MAKRRSGDGPAVANLEEAEERLYGVPLEDFVATRNELAKALRAVGDAEGARTLASLRKPPVALWAVDQLARRFRGEVEELLAAGEALRRAQAADPESFRSAVGAERRLVASLTERAAQVLKEGGHAASEASLARVRSTLQAASGAGDEARERLRRGTLREEIEPAGFARAFAVIGLARPGSEAPRRRPPTPEAEDATRALAAEADAVTRGLDLQRRRLERAETALREGHDALHEAERALAQARERVSRAARERDHLRETLRSAEARERELRAAVAAAEARRRGRR